MSGRLKALRDAIAKRAAWIVPSALVAVFLLGLAVPGVMHQDTPGGRRWNKVTKSEPTKVFKDDLDPTPINRPIPDEPIDWMKPHVAVYSVPAPEAPHVLPTIKDLGDSGQAHAIDILAQNIKELPHVWSDLQQTLTDPSEKVKDPFRFDRVLVATVARGLDLDTSDRMVWTRVFVKPINFSFIGYSVAATENETVKVTSFEATNTRKLSADIGLKGIGVEKADLSPSTESSVKTTGDIQTQYEKLGVDIMPNFLRIIRESGAGGRCCRQYAAISVDADRPESDPAGISQ